jgi:hypothetical protein
MATAFAYPSALAPFSTTSRDTNGDGHAVERSFQVGETFWMDEQSHIGENVGTTDTHVLLIELLEPRPAKSTK